MPTTCKIEFDNNPMKIFLAGQVVRGTVQLGFDGRKIVRSVYIRMIGLGIGIAFIDIIMRCNQYKDIFKLNSLFN